MHFFWQYLCTDFSTKLGLLSVSFLFQTVGEQPILLALPCGGMTEIPFREYVPNPKNLVFPSMHK